MSLDEGSILKQAIKAVPSVKYALGVAGVIAAIAIVKSFGLGWDVAVIGGITMLGMMTLLVVFAGLSTSGPSFFRIPSLLMTYAFVLLAIATAVLFFSSAFFNWPLEIRDRWLPSEPKDPQSVNLQPATQATTSTTAVAEPTSEKLKPATQPAVSSAVAPPAPAENPVPQKAAQIAASSTSTSSATLTPSNPHAAEVPTASKNPEEDAYEKALSVDTLPSWRNYQSEFPLGAHIEDASKHVAELKKRTAEQALQTVLEQAQQNRKIIHLTACSGNWVPYVIAVLVTDNCEGIFNPLVPPNHDNKLSISISRWPGNLEIHFVIESSNLMRLAAGQSTLPGCLYFEKMNAYLIVDGKPTKLDEWGFNGCNPDNHSPGRNPQEMRWNPPSQLQSLELVITNTENGAMTFVLPATQIRKAAE